MKESGPATASASAASKPRRKNRHTQLVDAIEPEKVKLKHLVFLAARKNPDITDLQYYGEYVVAFSTAPLQLQMLLLFHFAVDVQFD